MRDQDPTIRRGQLVGLPHFYVVAVEKPRVQRLPNKNLEEPPVASIHRLHLIGSFREQKPEQRVALLQHALEILGGLDVQIVGKKDGLFLGCRNGRTTYTLPVGVARPGIAECRVGPRASLPINLHAFVPRRLFNCIDPLSCTTEDHGGFVHPLARTEAQLQSALPLL